ncbi:MULTISPECIES: DUF5348 domain-containing protein [unclassified Sporosarcina]|uniref:DUF5348 domain-containing protein n=1 Tax=unclassified Sporosarcina TaxID=2647733 RepID=UPI00203F92F9|nr:MULTISPECIES: DUF5348 domain-containing protein [unclassified Sporosarcina]GKV65246.1 hypothetical protein NCCP2331_13990 [Sporosarcina sp. NCCP-2331]GLB55370.1 hypothetical protein NCCP2378_11570 [Sporosarcina sp. NCCP-2378]
MKLGIMVYDHRLDEWRVWIGQQSYWLEQGYPFELRIKEHYYSACLYKEVDSDDEDWSVILIGEVVFILHMKEVYRVRLHLSRYMSRDAPF